jgi:hypothetical protein
MHCKRPNFAQAKVKERYSHLPAADRGAEHQGRRNRNAVKGPEIVVARKPSWE